MGATSDPPAGPDSAVKRARTVGRRGADRLRQGSTVALAIGTLLQGGFLLVTQRLLTMGERQLDRERALLVEQHNEIVTRIGSLEARASGLSDAAATVRGIVLDRYKCPDLTCPTLACPSQARPIIITTTPAPQPAPPPLQQLAPLIAPAAAAPPPQASPLPAARRGGMVGGGRQ